MLFARCCKTDQTRNHRLAGEGIVGLMPVLLVWPQYNSGEGRLVDGIRKTLRMQLYLKPHFCRNRQIQKGVKHTK